MADDVRGLIFFLFSLSFLNAAELETILLLGF